MIYALSVQLIVGDNAIYLYDYLGAFVLSIFEGFNGSITSMTNYVGYVYESVDYVTKKTGLGRVLIVNQAIHIC